MKHVFKIKGSAPDPYVVTIERDGEKLNASCTCPAGEMGQHCKHRDGLLHGAVDGLIQGDIAAIAGWLQGSNLEPIYREIGVLENEQDRIKKEISAKKRQLARLMGG